MNAEKGEIVQKKKILFIYIRKIGGFSGLPYPRTLFISLPSM